MTELTELHAAGTTSTGADATDLLLITDVSDTTASADGTSKAIRAQHVGRIISGDGAPASTPPFVGAVYIDTTGDFAYVATGTGSSADWDPITSTVLGAPGADRLLGYDHSATADAYLTPTGALTISGTNVTVSAASDSAAGVVELATTAETSTGTDATRAVTPDGLRDATHTGLILANSLATMAENAQTGTTYTLALADHGRGVSMANASAQTLTIPANATVAFPVGAMIPVVSKGAGVLTITAASGVTLNGVSAGSGVVGTPASGLYPGVTLYKVATNAWYVVGNIAAVA